MTITTRAVYQGGLLRPVQPLPLHEGATVDVTIATVAANGEPTTPSEDESIRRIQACQSLEEWLQFTKSLPSDEGGYDILKALDENRRWSGDRPLTPTEGKAP